MVDVFISYSRRDAAFVSGLQEALEARGKSVWLDVEGIRAGEVFPEVLRNAIEQSDAFVYVLSPDSLTSTYCAAEIAHAEGLDKRILPLLLRPPGDAAVPAAVRDRNWIMFDQESDFGRSLDELIQALDADLGHVRDHTRLLVRAIEWDNANRDRSRLLRGADLEAAEAWLTKADSGGSEPSPTELHRRLVADSRGAATRRTRVLAIVSTAVAIVAVALLLVALVSRRDAVEERRTAQGVALTATAARLGIQSQTDNQLDHATLLARQAVALEDSVTTRGYLFGVLTRAPAAIGTLPGAGNKHQTMVMRPDGRLLVLGGAGEVTGLDPTDRDAPPIVGDAKGQGAPVGVMRFTRDGRLLAAGLVDGTVLVYDGSTLALRATFTDLRPHGISGLDFSADGTRLAASCGCQDFARTAVWDVASSKLVVSHPIPEASAGIFFTSDPGELLLPQGRGTLVLDASTLETRRRIDVSAVIAALSPDGRTLAVTGLDGTLELLDTVTGDKHPGIGRHSGPIYSLTFSLDSSQLVTTSGDHSVISWNVDDGSVRSTLVGFAGCDCGAALSNDGATVFTNGFNGDVVVWDLAGDRRFVRPFQADLGRSEAQAAATSPTGAQFARVAENGDVVVFDAMTRRTVSRIPPAERPPTALAFSQDGSRLAVATDDGAVRIHRTVDGSPVGETIDGGGFIYSLAFTDDTSSLLALRDDGELLRLANGRASSIIKGSSGVSLAVNPSSGEIAVAREDGQVQVLTPSGKAVRTFQADPEFVGTAAYSRDGRFLVTAGDLGARLWTSTGRPLGGVLPGELDPIIDVAFSPDAELVATVGGGGVVRLYDVATGQELGSGVPGASEFGGGLAFTRDGRFLVAHYPGGAGFTMPASVEAWKERACAIAGRALTRAEWKIDVPGRSYQPACR